MNRMNNEAIHKELGNMICEPKVYYYYDQPSEPSTDDEFDYEPVDFHHKGLHMVPGYVPEPVTRVRREEHTLLVIKPSGFAKAHEIIQRVRKEGFTILKKKSYKLFPEQAAAAFYSQYFGRAWFPKAMLKMSSGPIMVLCLAKENAVNDLRALVGPMNVATARKNHPYSLRALYGLKGDFANNAVHASYDIESARREILFFFPNARPEPQKTLEEETIFLKGNYYSVLLEGLSQLAKCRPMNPALWLGRYLMSYEARNGEQDQSIVAEPMWPPPPLENDPEGQQAYKALHPCGE